MPHNFKVQSFQPGVDKPADIAALHLKIREWQKAIGQNDFDGHLLGSQKDLRDLKRNYVDTGGNFFIAKDDEGGIIGFIGLKNNGNGEGIFKRLAVIPHWQRNGVGKTLVSMAMEWAKQAGFIKLSLQTHSQEYAKPLYEQFGFRVIGWVEDRQDWLMECDLR